METLDTPRSLHLPITAWDKLKGVIVVIPAYNEELVIGSVVLKATRLAERVIVVDDGSADRTAEVAKEAGAEVIRLDKNHGKAHALLLGLLRARELSPAAAISLDGDGQHTCRDIPRVAQPVLDGKADLVIGSRFLDQENAVPVYRRVGQKTLDMVTNIGSGHKVSDSQSGFRAFSKKALDNLDFASSGFSVESDMITHFAERGLVITEVPINVRYKVPHKHKMNPLSHGLSVLHQVISVISYRRPMLAFGIPAAILTAAGLIAEVWVFHELYTNNVFHYTLAVGSGFVVILGMLLGTTAIILNALVVLMEKTRLLR